MMYRAKITDCYQVIESIYDMKKMCVYQDSKDTYIVVDTEEEAENIELLNEAQKRSKEFYTIIWNIVHKWNP